MFACLNEINSRKDSINSSFSFNNTMDYSFRQATLDDLDSSWKILEDAIRRRKDDGSDQWQDGYPNLSVITDDINKKIAYVLTCSNDIVGYCTILINDEPAYANIEGKWLSEGDYVVCHRLAISENYLGKGLAKKILKFIEEYALSNHIYSIKADTNFDNIGMLKTFEKLDYKYCGEVFLRGAPRKAYEKLLNRN